MHSFVWALMGKQVEASCPSLGSVPDSGEKSFGSPGPVRCSAAIQEAIEHYSGLLMTLFILDNEKHILTKYEG